MDNATVSRLPPMEALTYDSQLVKQSLSSDPQDWSVSGDVYRRKIEALRNEVGNGWLSVLSEEGWEGQKNTHGGTDFNPASTIRPSSTTQRANSQQTIHSGRTLG
jgi:hypothetical protein